MYLNHKSLKKIQFFKMIFVTLFSGIFVYTCRYTVTLLTVVADRISRVLKTSGASQTVVLDIIKAFTKSEILVSVTILGYMTL